MNRFRLNRDLAARWTFGLALVVYAYHFFTRSLVHQMKQPTLFETGFDYTYWLYQASGFPKIFVQHQAGAILFDLILGGSTLYCCISSARRWPIVLLAAVSWSLYGLTYNSYSCHHNVTMIGIMVLPYAFIARKEASFGLVWDGFRYFCLYAYADAFINKAFIGQNLFHPETGVEFIKTNQALYMVQHPTSALTAFYTFFITHPVVAYGGFLFMVILQGSMMLGFFTKRWDRYLFLIPFIFHTLTWIFVDVFFYELLLLNLTLLPMKPFRADRSLPRKNSISCGDQGSNRLNIQRS